MAFKSVIEIGGIKLGKNKKPFIVAELSGNHNQSLSRALRLVDLAADSGANAIKLQTYTPETLTLKSNKNEFKIKDKKNLWYNQNLFKLYQKSYTPWDWHKIIFDYAKKKGLVSFSTPFDESAVDFLEKLNVPAYKIASFENNHFPLIKRIAKTKKPMIISLGMTRFEEIKELISFLKKLKVKELILLKCTSTYPTNPIETNLKTISKIKEKFDCLVGLSDHTLGIGVPIASIPYEVSMIEKHFTDSRKKAGVDSAFSLEPKELKMLCEESNNAWLSLGKVKFGPTQSEISSLKYRRSIYISKNIKKNQLISYDNIKIIRPGHGLHPKYYERIIGKKVIKDLKKGTPIKFEYLKK